MNYCIVIIDNQTAITCYFKHKVWQNVCLNVRVYIKGVEYECDVCCDTRNYV